MVDFESARDALDVLCEKVQLQRTQSLPLLEINIVPPDNATLWLSSYASVLLWPCNATDLMSIQESASLGQTWFDEILSKAEQNTNGRPVDGYLVLALPESPASDAREGIRRLELSTQVCRKHIIWPAPPEEQTSSLHSWLRLADVTVLGLPGDVGPSSRELLWPELDAEANKLWNELGSLGVAEMVLRHGGER